MKMGAIKRPESTNPALEAYNKSCTHAVVVYFLYEWAIVTRCRTHAEARMCLLHWRERSSWKSKVIKLEVSNGLSTQRRPL